MMDASLCNALIEYADIDSSLLSTLVGGYLTHKMYGKGEVASLDITKYGVFIEVYFDDSHTRKFNIDSFSRGHLSNMHLSDDALFKIKALIKPFLEEKARKEKEEELRRLEEEKVWEAQRLQEEKEKIHLAEFRLLKNKYGLADSNIDSVTSPLYMMLIKFESGEYLSDLDIEWIESEGLFALLARHYESNFERTKDYWDLVKASSNYRKSNEPEKSITLLGNLSVENGKLMSAILTSLSAAYKDITDIEEAERLANQATSIYDSSFHPYNVLGSIYYQRGMPEKGDVFFNKAIELGSSQKFMDNEIRNALKVAGDDEKVRVAKYLLNKDAQKYNWARFYV